MIDRMSYSFLGGPPLVKAATGEVISAEDLGGLECTRRFPGVQTISARPRTKPSRG